MYSAHLLCLSFAVKLDSASVLQGSIKRNSFRIDNVFSLDFYDAYLTFAILFLFE